MLSKDFSRIKRFACVLLLMFVTGLACADDANDTGWVWTGADFSGNTIDFPAILNGKPTVLVFWATWCPYCKALMPYLGEIQKDYGSDKINILLVNVFEEKGDRDVDPAAYVEALGFPTIAVANGDGIAEDYSIRFTPGLLVVDGQGETVWKRASTDLPAGKTVAEFWSGQLRQQLDLISGQ